jgi:hypothetical protein
VLGEAHGSQLIAHRKKKRLFEAKTRFTTKDTKDTKETKMVFTGGHEKNRCRMSAKAKAMK